MLLDYIKGRAAQAGVLDHVRLNTVVRSVTFDDTTNRFTVRSHSLLEDQDYSEEFDYVMVATGHFSVPNVPSFPGMEGFEGRVLHAHDFRQAMEFAGQDVLVVGSSYSAEDIGAQLYKFGARSITFSYRSAPMGFDWPSKFETRPLLSRWGLNHCLGRPGWPSVLSHKRRLFQGENLSMHVAYLWAQGAV